MALILIILLELAVIMICEKENRKKIIASLLMLLLGNFLILDDKLYVDTLVPNILPIPAMVLLTISAAWFIILIDTKKGKRLTIAIGLCFTMTILIFALPGVPSLSEVEEFKLYKEDYFAISGAIFQAYDKGYISVEDRLNSPPSKNDLERLGTHFSNGVIRRMKKLSRVAGISFYDIVDKDVIHFGDIRLHSSAGIAICRNGKDPSTDIVLKSQFHDVITYRHIANGIYYFSLVIDCKWWFMEV
ncbi:hypothetical protein ACNQFZ_13185 [Schinkia sp. CFF1]